MSWSHPPCSLVGEKKKKADAPLKQDLPHTNQQVVYSIPNMKSCKPFSLADPLKVLAWFTLFLECLKKKKFLCYSPRWIGQWRRSWRPVDDGQSKAGIGWHWMPSIGCHQSVHNHLDMSIWNCDPRWCTFGHRNPIPYIHRDLWLISKKTQFFLLSIKKRDGRKTWKHTRACPIIRTGKDLALGADADAAFRRWPALMGTADAGTKMVGCCCRGTSEEENTRKIMDIK